MRDKTHPIVGTLSRLGSEHTVGAGAGALARPTRCAYTRVVVARMGGGEGEIGEQHDQRDAGGGAHLGAVGGACEMQ